MKKLPAKAFFHVLINALAIYAAVRFIDGITMEITLTNLLLAGALLGLVNVLLRPILVLFSLPFIILTFGLFTVIINISLLFLVSFLFPSFAIEGFWAALWGVIVISLVNYLLSYLIEN
ncbi:MAG: phage holin family protein [Candidatus Moranbacteria bacterium]|nr:phage holin family protein [Candidatus Moranbacteria bacterium]